MPDQPDDADREQIERAPTRKQVMDHGTRVAVMTDEGYRRHVIRRVRNHDGIGRPDTFWNAPEFTNKP